SARDLLEKFSDFSVDLGHSVSSAMLKRQAQMKMDVIDYWRCALSVVLADWAG
ncbi:unnamed protein product, partial [Symbiodinium pilosum]